MDNFSRQTLEFPAVLELLGRYLSGPIGETRLAALAPHTRLDEIQSDLERARDAREYLSATPRPRLGSLKDPRAILEKLRVEGVALPALEILALVDVARAARDFRTLFAKGAPARLSELAHALADFRDVLAELEGKILPGGTVDSSASAALARIRKSIDRLRQELHASLEHLLHRLARGQILQDAVVTLRNDRFVIPVRAEEKRRVPGVVHGASSSGATVYIEPLETVPLNNELVELQDREAAEVRRILGEFSEKLRQRREELLAATEILSDFDLAFAKAEFARDFDCCLPEFDAGRALLLQAVRHPLLEMGLRGRNLRSVPLSFELREPHTLMIISGPNTGGKTVALKTLGLAVLMAQAGLPVAAEAARLPLFGHVLADIGDQQSIQANLSTFSAHVRNIQSMLEAADRNDLVLLDELGASTEPSEGAALAVALLERFRALAAMTLVTTHHSRLKAYASETPQAVNAAMEFNETTLQPTYRLRVGLPGKSSALDIAARLGLEAAVVEQARAYLPAADAEAAKLIARLHEQQAELELRLTTLEAERSHLRERQAGLERQFAEERRAKLRQLDGRLEESIRQNDRKLEAALAGLGAAGAAAKKVGRFAAAARREAREEWNAQVLESLGEPATGERGSESTVDARRAIAVGDRVRVVGVSTPGLVTALVGQDQLEVEVGRLRMRVGRDEVRAFVRPGPPAPSTRATLSRVEDVPEELNVIGNTAEEARERVDKFLDQAYLAGRFHLRIVHGHGKGILRKTLHEMLASHPHVEKFDAASPREGGAGATLVELKT